MTAMSLREALRDSPCPRPANGEPDDQTVGACVDGGNCGCQNGEALRCSADSAEPIGYLLEKSGVNNGFYFVEPASYKHVEERFQSMYRPVYARPAPSASVREALKGPQVASECDCGGSESTGHLDGCAVLMEEPSAITTEQLTDWVQRLDWDTDLTTADEIRQLRSLLQHIGFCNVPQASAESRAFYEGCSRGYLIEQAIGLAAALEESRQEVAGLMRSTRAEPQAAPAREEVAKKLMEFADLRAWELTDREMAEYLRRADAILALRGVPAQSQAEIEK